MTVYVDDMRMRKRLGQRPAKWSHLFADSVEELHEFAERIGLKRIWFQDSPTEPHYDVTETRRLAAIAAGATPVNWPTFARERIRERQRSQGLHRQA